MRGIDLPRVPDDAINENQIFVLDDPTQSFSITLAQLKEFIKAYLDDVFVNANGDTMTDRLIIECDSDAMRFKNDTQGKPIYLICQDADGANRFYLGIGEEGTSNASLYNYIGGGNRITVADNGAILLTPRGGGFVISDDVLMANGDGPILRIKNKVQGKALNLLAQDADGSNKWYAGNGTDGSNDLTIANYKGGNSITLAVDSSARLVNPNGGIFLNADGSTYLSDYKHFDARYQKINTASKAVNGWFRDTNTGVIKQWGTASGGADDAYYTVTLPIAFPSAFTALSVLPIYDDAVTSGHVLAAHGSVKSLTQFGYGISNGASDAISANGVYWSATGYAATTKRNQEDFDHLAHFGFAESAYFYSAMNNAFYPSSLFNDYMAGDGWPDDAVMVGNEIYLEYAANRPPEGKERIAGADGMPIWGDEVFLELTPAQHQAKKNALLKKAGGEIDALRDVVKYSGNPKQYAASLEEWERYRAAVYVATPEEAVKIPLPE